jgi:hypothetical protein
LNLRPSGYEPDELPDCSTPHQRGGIILTGYRQYKAGTVGVAKARGKRIFHFPGGGANVDDRVACNAGSYSYSMTRMQSSSNQPGSMPSANTAMPLRLNTRRVSGCD